MSSPRPRSPRPAPPDEGLLRPGLALALVQLSSASAKKKIELRQVLTGDPLSSMTQALKNFPEKKGPE